MSKFAPVPFKKAARSSIAGLVNSLGALVDAAKGTLENSEAKSAKNVPTSVTLSLPPCAESQIAVELENIVESVNLILAEFASLDAAKVLPNKVAVYGGRSLVGKRVHAAAGAPKKLKEKFGAAPRLVEAEVANDETGEVDVRLEGGLVISKANVVLKKAA